MNPDRLDRELVHRLLARDDAVLVLILARYGASIAGVVRGTWQGIPDSDVEEVVADALADAWFLAADIDLDRGRFHTWLAMRARFRTLDRLRRARRVNALFARLARTWGNESGLPEYPSDLDAYLATLNEIDRRLLQLRFLDGRPVNEIAAISGLTPKAVEHRLARIKTRLPKRIDATQQLGVENHA